MRSNRKYARSRGAVELYKYRADAAERFARLRSDMLAYLADHPEGVSRFTLCEVFKHQDYSIDTLLKAMLQTGELIAVDTARYRLTLDKWVEVVS